MSTNLNNYVRPTDATSRRDINKILELIHDLVAQIPEETGLQERIMFTPHVKVRTTSVTFGEANLLNTDVLDLENFNWRRKKPESVDVYTLIHTQVGAGTLTFPVSDTWFGGRCDADGTNYITIDDDDILDPTATISIALNGYLPASGGGFVLVEKVNQYRLRVADTNTLEWAVYVSGAYKTAVTFTYTPNTKYSIVATYKSSASGQKLYVDGSLVDSDSETGSMSGTSNKLGILATGAGANIALDGTRIALLSILNAEVDSTWVTSYGIGLLDTSDGNDEMTTIAFIGDDSVTPNAETGLFKAS